MRLTTTPHGQQETLVHTYMVTMLPPDGAVLYMPYIIMHWQKFSNASQICNSSIQQLNIMYCD